MRLLALKGDSGTVVDGSQIEHRAALCPFKPSLAKMVQFFEIWG